MLTRTVSDPPILAPEAEPSIAYERFVPLPFGRSQTGVTRRASLHATPANVFPTEVVCTEVVLVSALAILLHRVTAQTLISIDVLMTHAEPQHPLDIALHSHESTAPLIERIAASLASATNVGEARAAANVAVAFTPFVSNTAGDGELLPALSRYELVVVLSLQRDALQCLYHPELQEGRRVERFAAALSRLVEVIASEDSAVIPHLPIMTDDELGAVKALGRGGPAPSFARAVHEQFQSIAQAAPHRIAARAAGVITTYGELEQRSNRLARYLRGLGVGPEIPVAVCVQASCDILVSLLAIFKAGGVYLPIDPTHPKALVALMLDEAQPRIVLTQTAVRETTRHFPQLCLDADAALLDQQAAEPLAEPALLTATAYLIYTSGTTGKPKAVRATQANLAHYIELARHQYGFTEEDRFASLARYTFSISMFELLSPLCCGASVHLTSRESVLDISYLVQLLSQVTVVHAGPSLLSSLFRYLRESAPGRRFSNVRHASSGGDIVPPIVMEQMKTVFDQAELYVIYGCSEISCMGCTYPLSRTAQETLSLVGKPFSGTAARVLDSRQNYLPFGAIGEIAFSGGGVVPGYLNRLQLTDERFVEIDGERYYLTGDVGRLHESGDIEFLGRRDFQVQVRGIRVELAGIENTIVQLGLASQCAVVARKLDDEDTRLIAFVTQPRENSATALRRALAAHLPDYMLPQHVVHLEALPLTANGKLDRVRLQTMPWDAAREAPVAGPPPTPLEQQIAAIFASALKLDAGQLSIEGDFFDLGGHSLLAVTVTRALEACLGTALHPGVLFQFGSVRALARHVAVRIPVVQHPVLLTKQAEKPPLFLVAGVHVYRALAHHLADAFSVYGVFTGCELTVLSTSSDVFRIPELAAEYIAIIRRQQPHGPYRIAGTSFGGIVVYEMAQQLRQAGETVALVGLIDAILPELGLSSWLERARRLLTLPAHQSVPLTYRRMSVKLARALARRRSAEFARYEDDERFRYMEILRADCQARGVKDYMRVIAPYDGPVTLVIAGSRLEANPHRARDCGWRRHVRGTLAQHVVAAGHLQLLDEPAVGRVATIFVEACAAALEQGHSACFPKCAL